LIADLRFITALLLVSIVPVWLDRRARRGNSSERQR
jgi:hypothetical protein